MIRIATIKIVQCRYLFISVVVCGIEEEGVDKIECGSVSICVIDVFICLNQSVKIMILNKNRFGLTNFSHYF